MKILRFRLRPTVSSAKRGKESEESSRKSGRNFGRYPDGKRNKNNNEAVSFRNDAMGFNDCPDERRSEIRIACALCNMNRDVSRIVSTIKGIGNKVIIASHYVLFFALVPHKRDNVLIRRSITIISSIRFQL